MKSLLLAFLSMMQLSAWGQVSKELNLLPRKEWISFQWEGSVLGNRYFDKAYMNVPFQIDNVPDNFKIQFDLGATNSMIYGKAIAPYLLVYPELAAKLDTLNKPFRIQSSWNGSFENVTIKLDKTSFSLNELVYFKDFGEALTADSIHSNAEKHIGTLGASFFRNKILLIDYPKQQMVIVDSLDSETENRFNFVKCRIEKGRIKIPFTIEAKTYWVMFDTGSSIFPLITNKKFFNKLSHGNITDTLAVSSWGKSYPALGRKTKHPVEVCSVAFPRSYVYLMPNFTKFFKQEKIIGLTGNALFLENVIAIDFKSGKFGILKD